MSFVFLWLLLSEIKELKYISQCLYDFKASTWQTSHLKYKMGFCFSPAYCLNRTVDDLTSSQKKHDTSLFCWHQVQHSLEKYFLLLLWIFIELSFSTISLSFKMIRKIKIYCLVIFYTWGYFPYVGYILQEDKILLLYSLYIFHVCFQLNHF